MRLKLRHIVLRKEDFFPAKLLSGVTQGNCFVGGVGGGREGKRDVRKNFPCLDPFFFFLPFDISGRSRVHGISHKGKEIMGGKKSAQTPSPGPRELRKPRTRGGGGLFSVYSLGFVKFGIPSST